MQFLEPKKQLEIILENVSEVIPVDELLDKLTTSFKKNTPLKIKAGFDPTSSDLHLGHSLLLKKLKVFQVRLTHLNGLRLLVKKKIF